MTPQELKYSILQLAIRGKLVEQRPEEGNAEELYQQIQAEKQRLIKRTENDDEYVLIRNLNQVDFWRFYNDVPFTLPLRRDIENIHDDDEWMKYLAPHIIDADEYLKAHLSIPLSELFENKMNYSASRKSD